MGKIDVPMTLTVNGQIFNLNTENVGDAVILTYEHEPINDESFLISAYGKTVESANKKMGDLLKTENLI